MTDGLRYRPASGNVPAMALRIHQSLVRGEIDNRRRGRVEGWITLVEVEWPVTLELTGNCLRDLAGCVVRFENPHPLAREDEENVPALLQQCNHTARPGEMKRACDNCRRFTTL